MCEGLNNVKEQVADASIKVIDFLEQTESQLIEVISLIEKSNII